MVDFTPLLRPYFRHVALKALRSHDDVERAQMRVLRGLVGKGEVTRYGRRYGITRGMTYREFAERVPLVSYPDVRADIMDAVEGHADVLWPGITKRFAQSSGTTDGKSKYVPLTDDSLRMNHYRGGLYSVGHYLRNNPDSHIFGGKAFILGGSFANEIAGLPEGVKVGDLSAHLIDNINPLVERLRVPSHDTALMEAWHEKLPRLISESVAQDVTNISGVPSWFLTVLRGVLKERGASSIHDVWPNLEVFFHGGISFDPYREQYAAITDSARMHYLETYNASEGFFAVQDDPAIRAMLLMITDGVFYEFIPVVHSSDESPKAVPAWEVADGEIYELVITSCNGLWRYRPGDTVRVHGTSPLRITIEGRTKQYINAFGEELMVYNADAAMAEACHQTGASVVNYTAAPVYTTDKSKGRHQWLVEFETRPADMDAFAATLDKALQSVNSDYQAKRSGDIFLAQLSLTVARKGLFDEWLASTGKLGGQRKVPRLCPDRHIIEPMLALNERNQ